MVNITKETYENNDIEVIIDRFDKLWLNEKHVEQQLGHKNLLAVTNKYDEKYKKCRYELIDEPIKQSYRKFIRNDLALKIIMDCRTCKSCNLKRNPGDMQTQYTVIGYRIDLYFHEYKLSIEVDEFGHNDRNIDYEIQRQRALQRELNCVFIRINPDAVDFNIFREINKIHRHIKESSKKSIIGKFSKRLLELEFVSDHSIKSKCLKWIVRKRLPTL